MPGIDELRVENVSHTIATPTFATMHAKNFVPVAYSVPTKANTGHSVMTKEEQAQLPVDPSALDPFSFARKVMQILIF
jgi:hypothetical protein